MAMGKACSYARGVTSHPLVYCNFTRSRVTMWCRDFILCRMEKGGMRLMDRRLNRKPQ